MQSYAVIENTPTALPAGSEGAGVTNTTNTKEIDTSDIL